MIGRNNVKINNPERFKGTHSIDSKKIQMAIEKATGKLASKLELYEKNFPQNMRSNCYHLYEMGENNNWQSGMLTGCLILAYDLTGDKKFLDTALGHIPTYQKRFENRADPKYDLCSHDVGFAYSPSCGALYKRTGNEEAKNIAHNAARHFYNVSYTQRGKFILRSALKATDDWACRTMMDSLLNVPLLFWAGEEFANVAFTEAAYNQNKLTRDLLIREDGSSYHHYQFDIDSHAPVKGVTFQGHRDESTWSRGHAWGIYGFPVAYDYTGDDSFLKVQKDQIALMAMNHATQQRVRFLHVVCLKLLNIWMKMTRIEKYITMYLVCLLKE